jgi:competence protein ComEA
MKRILSSIILFLTGIGMALAAVNINTATVDELNAIKGIGPAKAKAIVEYRDKNGPYKSLDDLKGVKGFGDKSVDKLRDELIVGDAAPASTKKK